MQGDAAAAASLTFVRESRTKIIIQELEERREEEGKERRKQGSSRSSGKE